jgi:hypothetical protein
MAVHNNADWCDLVCRTHGIATTVDQDAWLALRRSPPLYPDAVTLRERVRAGDLLRRVDSSPGCSIKDSYASVDLSGHGFRLLFEAEWVHRPAERHPAGQSPEWTQVRTAAQLRAWAGVHGGGDVFHPALLEDPAVAILAAHDGDTVVAGAIANRSATAIGLSNVFTTTIATDRVWSAAVNAISVHFPGLPVVGYERGPSLRAAHRAGFTGVGPLRVWVRELEGVARARQWRGSAT